MNTTITTTGFDAINTIGVQLPSDLPLAGIPTRDQLARLIARIPTRDQLARLTMPGRTKDAAQAKARALVSNDIDSYSAATLDAIANALHGKPKTSGDDEFHELAGDIERHLQTGLTLLDYDEELRFCQYEQVWGECYKAYMNGQRIKERLSAESEKLKGLMRDNDGSEIPEQKVEDQTARLRKIETRLWYWRAHFYAAHQVYKRWVRENSVEFPNFSATWEAPQSRAAAKRRQQTQQRQTAAQAAAASVTQRLATVTRNSRTASDGRSRPTVSDHVARG